MWDTVDVFSYIDQEIYSGNNVTVEACSEHFGYSTYHFSRLFKKNVGISAATYISALKMEKCVQLILQPNLNVTDAYSEMHYQSPSSFTRNFKKYTGMSPLAYKNSAYMLAQSIDLLTQNGPFEMEQERVQDERGSTLQLKVNIPEGCHIKILYVGFYKEKIALGAPIVGKALFSLNETTFTNIPDGAYYILVSAVEENMSIERHFLVRHNMKGCTGTPITFPDAHNQTIEIDLAEPKQDDLPVLINLPNLVQKQQEKHAQLVTQ